MKALVTGGAGFIGSNLALFLEEKGHEVAVVDNYSSGNDANLEGFKGKKLNIDISTTDEIEGEYDVIFHQAGLTDPRFGDDKEMIRANVEGFKNVISLAKKNNAKLIYASTANLYGNNSIPQKEDGPTDLISAYGKSKLLMDKMAEGLKSSMHIVGLRYFNVFGPRESYKGKAASMIYHLSQQMKERKKPKIFRFGEQTRDHIYVKDCVRANILAIDALSGIYNVGTGIATSFNKLIEILNEVLGTDYDADYIPMPFSKDSYQANTQADTTLAESNLKFKAEYELKAAIKEYVGELE